MANETTILKYLLGKLGNIYGVFGAMANIKAESGGEPKNLQNSYEKSLGYTDETYTAAVDNGTYTNFSSDSAGYGICQWTYSTRKAGLLKLAQSKGVSIGNLDMQMEYFYNELSSNYKSVLSSLKNATSILEASNAMLKNFEQPADQSADVQKKRAAYGQAYWDEYIDTAIGMMTGTQTRYTVANWLVQYLGIKEGSDEHKEILAIYNNSKLCTRYTMTTSDAWCAAAVSAAFIACGLTSIFPCVECSCANMITLAKTAGIWVESDSYTPSVGDLIMYDWQDDGNGDNTGTPDHVGIVYSVSGTTLKIIEGNKSDTVAYRDMTVNGQYIRGYITPKYANAAASGSSATSDSTATSGTALATGDKIYLTDANVYNTATATKATGTKTGTFFVWNGTATSGRVRITTKSEYVGKAGQVTCWVNVSDCTVASDSSAATGSTENTTYCGKGIGTAVAKTTMHIRDAASQNGKSLGTISKGTAVEVLEILTNTWYRIAWPGASCGYAYTSNASSKYYSYTANATATSNSSTSTAALASKKATESAQSGPDSSLAGTYTATTSLNVRNGAGVTSNSYGKDKNVLVTIPKGTSVRCYGYYTKIGNITWLYIQFAYNNTVYTGFASAAYLKKS